VELVADAAGRRPDLVAGKPQPEPFLAAARRHGAARPLVIGDRLDTDLQGANAAGMPGMAVMTGVSGVSDLVAAPPAQRPRYLAADLSGLLEPHPEVEVRLDGRVSAHCRGFTVQVDDVAGSPAAPTLHVAEQDGGDPVDLLRAACGAAWAWADLRDGQDVATLTAPEVSRVCARFEPAAAWAR
jgi:hypothetical protein